MLEDMPAIPDYRSIFNKKAEPHEVTIVGKARLTIKPKRFPKGGLGWTSGAQTVYMLVGDQWMECKATIIVKVVGSQKWPETRG